MMILNVSMVTVCPVLIVLELIVICPLVVEQLPSIRIAVVERPVVTVLA